MAIKVIVTGSRNWTDSAEIETQLKLLKSEYPNLMIVHGTEHGAESMVEGVCASLGIATITVEANYSEYQDSAITRRNEEMLSAYDPHMLYCFTGNIENEPELSKLVRNAQQKAIITMVVGRS